MQIKLGVDFGGVISYPREGLAMREDPLFMERPIVDGALDALRYLHMLFGDEVYVVSRCSEPSENKIINYLNHYGFMVGTGLADDRVHFCRNRKDKTPIVESLGITHFVDDRIEVLSYMNGVVPHRYALNPSKEERVRALSDGTSGIWICRDWPFATSIITNDIQEENRRN